MVCFSALAATANLSEASLSRPARQPKYQARRKAVAAADAIDQSHDVPLALMKTAGGRVEHHAAPRVVAGREALAERDGHVFDAEFLHDTLGCLTVSVGIQIARGDVDLWHVDAEDRLQILLVGDHHVDE